MICFSRRFQSLTGQETICFGSSASRAATNSELEAWKQELLAEVRMEIQTIKLEIIEGRFLYGDRLLVQRGSSLNVSWLRDRVSDRVRNCDELHLWPW